MHSASLKKALYSRTQTHRVPVHGANVVTGFVLAVVGGLIFPLSYVLGTFSVIVASALNGHSAYHITVNYNEYSLGYV